MELLYPPKAGDEDQFGISTSSLILQLPTNFLAGSRCKAVFFLRVLHAVWN